MIETSTDINQCPNCRAVVASDQSYCMSCGARQAGARMPFASRNGDGTHDTPTPQGSGDDPPPKDLTPVVALGGLALLALVLVIGVLIGRSGQNGTKLAGAPQVLTVGSGSAGGSNAGSKSGAITEDWPAGKSAWTVQLQTVPKPGATAASVDAAKSAATGKGAPAVGVLDAANYTNLGKDYIIYSGVYDTKGKATAALAKVKGAFSNAKVVHVVPAGAGASKGFVTGGTPPSAAQQAAGAATISKLNNCTGLACSKVARKITQPIATPGTAPPADNKAPGGGSSGQNFQ